LITVVSGLPRSGTSLMMQMLVAGGLPPLTDGLRSADKNNPKGYFEWEAAKALNQHPEAIADAEGKVVKIISAQLVHLPSTYEYRILFMLRPLEEVVSSQNRMLERMGKPVPAAGTDTVIAAFEKHLKDVDRWLANKSYLRILRVNHGEVLAHPYEASLRIAEFVGAHLSVENMAAQVEQSLYRERVVPMSSR
jgi:hypothetical protein